MTEEIGGFARLSAANEARALQSLEPHLAHDEEVVVNTAVRPNRGWGKRLGFTRLGLEPASVELPKTSVVAVTSHRVLVVSQDLSQAHTSSVLLAAEIDEVRSVQVDGTQVTWEARGTQYSLWSNGRFAQQFARALRREPLF